MRRAAGIFLALVLGLALGEGALRLLAWANRSLRARAVSDASGPTWVCIGDSNTYGVFEDDADTYPARLERLLARHAAFPPARVVNLGLPGTNGRQACAILADALERYEPDLVLLLFGVNNAWSWQAGDELTLAGPPWYEELRLARLVRLLAHAFAGGPRAHAIDALALEGDGMSGGVAGVDREGRPVHYTGAMQVLAPSDRLADSIRADMRRAAELVEAHGRRYCFLTYAGDTGGQAPVNQAIREAARALDAPLVDTARGLEPAFERFERTELFYPDGHPRALGYALFARALYAGLVGRGLVEGERLALLADELEAFSAPLPAPRLAWPAGAALPTLAIASGEPRRPCLVVVSRDAGGPPAMVEGLELPVRDDAVFRASWLHEGLVTETDDAGDASLDLAPLASDPAALAGTDLVAAYVLFQSRAHPRVRGISAGVRFRAR